MKKGIVLGLVALLSAGLLSGCSSAKANQPTVNVYNWGEYIDPELNEQFEQQTGIHVNYQTYATNEELYAKLKSGGVSYDVIIPSDYMVARMIEEGLIQPIDFTKVPNAQYLDEAYRTTEYDPQGTYSAAYAWGTVGILYNKTMVSETPDSWGALFNEQYAGQILMFDNSRDALGIALKYLGYSLNTTDEAQLQEAAELLRQQRPLVQAYVMDQIYNKMPAGEAALAPYYAGDAVTMMAENDDLGFVIPKEGANVFVDAMCIPTSAQNVDAAEAYINFMCDPAVMAQNLTYIGYSCPSTAARDLQDEEVKNDPIIYPSADILSRCEVFTNLPEQTLALYEQLWIDILK